MAVWMGSFSAVVRSPHEAHRTAPHFPQQLHFSVSSPLWLLTVTSSSGPHTGVVCIDHNVPHVKSSSITSSVLVCSEARRSHSRADQRLMRRMEGCALVKQSVCSEALQLKLLWRQLSSSAPIWSFRNFYL